MKIKNVFSAFLFLFLVTGGSKPLLGQNMAYIGVGGQFAFAQPAEINRIIDKYNAERQGDYSEMGTVQFLYGPAVNIGASLNGFLVDIGYRGRLSYHGSRSEASNTSRDLLLATHTAQIGLGKLSEISETFSLGGGLSLDFGTIQVSTRFRSQTFPSNYNPVVREGYFGSSLFAVFMLGQAGQRGWAVQIRPFVQMDWLEHDAFPLNRSLNVNSYFDDPDYLPFRLVNGGLSAIFCVYFR